MSKFTPGPWRQSAGEIIGAELTPDAWVVAHLGYGHISPAPNFDYLNGEHREALELTEANANLIAAAPKMYEALLDAQKIINFARAPLDLGFYEIGAGHVDEAIAAAQGAWPPKQKDAK